MQSERLLRCGIMVGMDLSIWRERRGSDGKPDWQEKDVHQLSYQALEWEADQSDDSPTTYQLCLTGLKVFPEWELLLDSDQRWLLYMQAGKRRLSLEPVIENVTWENRWLGTRLAVCFWAPLSFEMDMLYDLVNI